VTFTDPGLSRLRDRLATLHIESGEPSLREIAKRTRAISHTTVDKVLKCAVLPSKGQLEVVVEALGGDVGVFERLRLGLRLPASEPTADGLPPATTTFVGREAELKILHSERFVVISGLAGVGKSELALQYAHHAHFPGGRLFADFHGYDPERRRSAADILTKFLGELGAGEIPAHVDDRSALFRSLVAVRPPMLIVLDNVASAAAVEPLRLSGHQVVATSRHMLAGLNDACHIELGVLSPPEAAELVGDAEIAELCGRLPLALRIMKALRSLHPDEDWKAQLRQARLDTLDDDDRSVSAAFDLSYQALTPEQRRFLRMIVLHPSPQIMLEGAALLANISDHRARKLLQQLRAAHLVEPGDRFHDLVREYAAKLVRQDEERDPALNRFFDGLSRRAVARVNDFATTRRTQALNWFDRNHQELLATVVAASMIWQARRVIPLAGALLDYRAIRGQESDFELAATTAVHTGMNARDWRAEMNARIKAAYHCLDAGRDERAAAWFDSAWTQVRACQDADLIERTLAGFVVALERTGRHDAAAMAERDLRLFWAEQPRRNQ
jgi:hypothetical protein